MPPTAPAASLPSTAPSFVAALLPTPKPAAAESLDSPQYVSPAVMPDGNVGLVFRNVAAEGAETRFVRYTSERSMAPSTQLSTASPAYPQLTTFRGLLVAAYVDTRAPNSGKLTVRSSTDDGATWTAEQYPLGAAIFDTTALAPRVVASRDGQTLYVFSAAAGAIPQYRTTTDPALAVWAAPAPAGDSTMRPANGNNCGSSGSECYRAHLFEFTETALAGRWLYISKSDAGFGQSGRGTQYGTLGGSWSAQSDLGGSGGITGCCGESTATAFVARDGALYYVRAGSSGENIYHRRSTDHGVMWSDPVYAYSPQPSDYTTGPPVGLYVSGYSRGEYVWWAGFGGVEDAVRVDGLWATPRTYTATSTARLFGSAGSDWDAGWAHPYTFGSSDPPSRTGAGVFATSFTDLELAGRLLPLSFTRTYNSADITPGPLGRGWTHSFNWTLTEGDGFVEVRRGDGRIDRFARNPDGTYASPQAVHDVVRKNADGTFTLTTPRQTDFEFGTPATPPTTSDLALGKPTIACSPPYDIYVCSRVFDGNDATQFIANNSGGGAAASAGVDLGQPTSVGSFRFVGGCNGTFKRYVIEGSADATNWTTAHDSMGDKAAGDSGTVAMPEALSFRYWRLTGAGTATGGCGFQLFTLSLYSGGAAAVPGRLTRIHEPAGNTIALGYSGGALSKITDTVGRDVRLDYGSGRLVKIVDPTGREVNYSYDTQGRLASATRKAVAPVPVDFAAGKSPYGCSAAYSTYICARAIDGNDVTQFIADNSGGGGAATAGVDLGSAKIIGAFRANGGCGGSFRRYTIDGSPDGTTWTTSYDSGADVGAGDTGQIGFATPSTPARYWRLSGAGTTAGGCGFQLFTFALFAPSPVIPKWEYTYDGTSSHLATIKDPDTRVRTTNTYDAAGRAATQKDGLLNTTSFAYGASQTVITDPRNHQFTRTFDPRQRLLSESVSLGGVTKTLQYGYDASGNRTSIIDREGNRSDLTYDTRGNLLTLKEPQIDPQTPRAVTTYAYDARNNPTLVTDARGFQTALSYEATTNVLLSKSTQITPTLSATTKWQYTDAANPGLPTKVIAPRGNTTATPDLLYATTLAYDASGNLVETITADGAKTTSGYDALGRRTSTVDPDGNAAGGVPSEHTWTVAYDLNDRVTSESDPLNRVTTYGYNATGDRTSVTDRNGNITTYVHDAAARLWKVRQKPDPVGQPTLVYETAVSRDANGNTATLTRANGVVTDYAYDALDRLTAVTSHPTPTTALTTTYTLDGRGLATSRTAGNGEVVNSTYDAMGRLTQISASGLATISYDYDAGSLRTSMADGTGSSTYQYDGLGRLTQAAQPAGTTTYGYDLDSNRTSLGYPTVGSVTYAYTAGGRLSTVTDWAARASSYTYTAQSLPNTLTLASALGGLTTTYTYDRADRLTSLVNMVGTTTISSHAYTLDNEGNRTALAEFVAGITAPSTTDGFGLAYDGLLRLTSVSGAVAEGFTLDPGSNVTSRTGPAKTYTYDTSDRLTSDGVNTFTWDGADRLTGRGADTFGYDPLARLTGSTVASTARTYVYNGDGLLASWSTDTLPGLGLTPVLPPGTLGTTTSFLWDPLSPLARLLRIGAEPIVYGLGPLYAVRADGTTLAFARDGLKSVRVEVSGSGAVTKSFRYTAYGELHAASPLAAVPSFLGYNGQLRDGSGLLYLRARWYDPASGRFLTRDPLLGDPGSPATLNAFGYAGANPIAMSDPGGMASTDGGTRGDCRRVSTCGGFARQQQDEFLDEADAARAAARSDNPLIAATGLVEIAAGGVAFLALGAAVAMAAVPTAVEAGSAATLGVVAQRVSSANISFTTTVQEFHGGLARARVMFDYLSEGTGSFVSSYPGVMRAIDQTHRIGLRIQGGKPPTIDLHGFGRTIELKFK